jgi:hypothetical protein
MQNSTCNSKMVYFVLRNIRRCVHTAVIMELSMWHSSAIPWKAAYGIQGRFHTLFFDFEKANDRIYWQPLYNKRFSNNVGSMFLKMLNSLYHDIKQELNPHPEFRPIRTKITDHANFHLKYFTYGNMVIFRSYIIVLSFQTTHVVLQPKLNQRILFLKIYIILLTFMTDFHSRDIWWCNRTHFSCSLECFIISFCLVLRW